MKDYLMNAIKKRKLVKRETISAEEYLNVIHTQAVNRILFQIMRSVHNDLQR